MSTIAVTIPDSIHEAAVELAERECLTLNMLIALALAEKVTALQSGDYLLKRASRSSREQFEEALRSIPDVEPEEFDKL